MVNEDGFLGALTVAGALLSGLFFNHSLTKDYDCEAVLIEYPDGTFGGLCDDDPAFYGQPWTAVFGAMFTSCLAVLVAVVVAWLRWRWTTRDERRAEAVSTRASAPAPHEPDWSDWSHRT